MEVMQINVTILCLDSLRISYKRQRIVFTTYRDIKYIMSTGGKYSDMFTKPGLGKYLNVTIVKVLFFEPIYKYPRLQNIMDFISNIKLWRLYK